MQETFLQAIIFFVCMYVVIFGVIEANRRRDVVITGVQNGIPMTREHRRLILVNDWLPLKFGLALLCAVAAITIWELSPTKTFAELSSAAKAMMIGSGFGVLILIVYGALDLAYCLHLMRTLRS